MDKFFKSFFVTILLFLFPVVANAQCNIVIDGEELICRDANGTVVSPFVYEGTTYVPVRAIGEAFEKTINWEQETKTVYIGEKGGSPVLSENINIYVDGEEFVCLDANGTRVFPRLQDSTTFLPIRAIGQLFGKTVTWDNVSKTAILTTTPSVDAMSYFADAVSNTENHPALKVLVASDGTLSYNGKLIASSSNAVTEPYSTSGFTLSAFLPDDYTSCMSYLGNGKYFLAVSPDKIAKSSVQNILNKHGSSADFSMLYITTTIQGGYITELSMKFTALLSYNNLVFDEKYSITTHLQYPDDFSFPNIGFPEVPHKDNEAKVPIQSGENTDSTLILNLVDKYVKSSVNAKPSDMVKLLSTQDYNTIFKGKTSAQYNTEISLMKKRLAAQFANATGEYTVDSLVYVDASLFQGAERAAKALLSIEQLDEDEYIFTEIEITMYKSNGNWYLDPTAVLNLIR
ncbi:MAG: copper amine oxidase N-terminal domain-containing protein [Clostridia bacterium]|nr:copper amine oxidase N-terminal domain-containing protein [Clostridia bacterium]